MHTTIPKVICYRRKTQDGSGQWRFFCSYCQKEHFHGGSLDDKLQTHRAAHCSNPDSPYKKRGYYLKLSKHSPDVQ